MKYVIEGLTRFDVDPASFAVTNYDITTKNMILAYMKEAVEPNGVGGYIDDLKTGGIVQRTNCFYDDGEYLWSDQDIYHISKYNAAVDEGFIEHIRRKRGV